MIKKKDFIPALGYNWLTGLYDLTIKLTMPERKFRTKLIDILNPKNNESILEFGFGTGQNMILANQRNSKAKFTGVDIDPKVKQIADNKKNKLGITLSFDLYDGKTFPYADNSFDKVFSSLVFHHLDKETKLSSIKEIYRVLKPNGTFVILETSMPDKTPYKQGYNFYTKNILPLIGKIFSKDRSAYKYLCESASVFPYGEALNNILRKIGFIDVEDLPQTLGVATIYKSSK